MLLNTSPLRVFTRAWQNRARPPGVAERAGRGGARVPDQPLDVPRALRRARARPLRLDGREPPASAPGVRGFGRSDHPRSPLLRPPHAHALRRRANALPALAT